jgi:serpin B
MGGAPLSSADTRGDDRAADDGVTASVCDAVGAAPLSAAARGVAALGGGDGPAATHSLHALAEQVGRLVLTDGSEMGGPRVAFTDAVFVDASFKLKPAFEKVAVGKYKAETQSVDFQRKVDPLACKQLEWLISIANLLYLCLNVKQVLLILQFRHPLLASFSLFSWIFRHL